MTEPSVTVTLEGDRRLVQVAVLDDAWHLEAPLDRPLPTFSDQEMADKLHYAVNHLRQRIAELSRENGEKFKPFAFYPERRQNPGRGRPTLKCYRLTLHEALFLASQIKTQAARNLTFRMVDVAVAAIQGLMVSPEQVQRLVAQAREDGRMEAVRALPAMIDSAVKHALDAHWFERSVMSRVSKSHASRLRTRLCLLIDRMLGTIGVQARRRRAWKSLYGVEWRNGCARARTDVKFNRMTWEESGRFEQYLDEVETRLKREERHLSQAEKTLRERWEASQRAKQTDLFDRPTN